MKPVAVIMSVYHSDSLGDLVLAVDSVLSQSYSACDLFIYRDGKVSDEVDCYLESINKNNSNVYYYVDLVNKGLPYGLNFLIDRVLEKGSYVYVARMDSDDISRVERIERQVSFMENHPDVDISGASCHEFGASFALDEKHLPMTHADLIDFSIARCPLIHPSVIFRISIFRKGHRYPTNTLLTEDMAFWFQLLSSGFIFANTNEVLLDYRLNENTVDRRRGLGKAISEIRIRGAYMVKLRKITIKNILLIISKFIFHLLPNKLMKLMYSRAR